MFISFEGGEGAGKTTQIERLSNRLIEMGYEVVRLREPGSSEGAEAIRDLVLNGAVERWHPVEELFLFSAARHELVRRKIRPALRAGKIVLCDRFADSSAVYQGRAGGVAEAALATVEGLATEGLMPDLTFLIDIPVAAGLARATARIESLQTDQAEGRFEGKDRAFHEDVRQAFLDRAKAHASRFRIVQGDQSVEELAAQIWSELLRFGLPEVAS